MDELNLPGDVDDLVMDLEEAEGSEFDEDDEEFVDEQIQASFLLPSPGPCSAATSNASSPINDEFSTTPIPFPTNPPLPGKQLGIKRGRGRPRREGGKPFPKRPGTGNRMRKLKSSLYHQRGFKRWKSVDRSDFDLLQMSSPNDELASLDPETGTFVFTEREKQIPILEDLPYAPEQWPGKVCAFCNLGEKSQLGQGELLRLNCPEGFIPQRIIQENNTEISSTRSLNSNLEKENEEKSPRGPVTCRRQKSFNKCRHPSMTSEYIDELTIIGYSDEPDVSALFESTGHFYVHRNCMTWSASVVRNDNSTLDNVGPTVLQSSSKKCSFCSHYGASILCKVDTCCKMYHFPCATASGAFQEIKSFILFCSNHLGQATVESQDSVCYTCKLLGDISNLMYCSSCGEHYHGICVGLAQSPGVRAGWQCRKCRICQVCRMTGDETKLMTCEQCDKVYHASCQRPIVTSIPKYGWKCRCCRVCGDCGSRTPGAGLSSRWHAHYTVCDSCYQQRNKGFSCPLCHRAYRAHAHREMVQCSLCHKFVHGTCDPEADLMAYNQRKDQYPDYEYVCTMCKNHTMLNRQLGSKRSSIDEQNELSASQESLYDDNFEFDLPSEGVQRYMGLGKGKPYSASKIAKKRLGFGMVSNRPKGVGKILPGKVGFMKRQRLNEFCRKRGPKAKMRGLFGVPGVGLQRPMSDGKNDEEPGIENRLILCSAKDKFVLTQDICVMCGALGTDQEGCLIACVQCGQCYHPYCVNVKITKVILQNGWRCLDCTVCEGCGQRNDESRLILCDDCDISYHIYCMDPPLDYVPQGNWKCKWCAICQMCGNTDPGFNCQWMNSFSECGPCASQINCPACMEPYAEGELIIQCGQCERWLHGKCDAIKTEDDAEKCAADSYSCILCRPRDVPPPHLLPSNNPPVKPPTPTKSPELKASNSNYFMDGICLSESGHSLIKSMCLEYSASRKKRKKLPTVQDKEAGILATIESVVAGGITESGMDDGSKLDLGDSKEDTAELYKEGMIWTKEDGPAPEGFTIFTMESGISVLRRKRQRNLQKLGIGGFLVRVRGIRGSQENIEFEPVSQSSDLPGLCVNEADKPKRKPMRRKIKTKLSETFPSYLQEAFFGKDLMDSNKDLYYCKSEDEDSIPEHKDIKQEDYRNVPLISPKIENIHINNNTNEVPSANSFKMHLNLDKVEDFPDNADDIGDVLNLVPGGLLDNDLVNTIMNEDKHSLPKKVEDIIGDTDLDSVNSADLKPTIKDEMDILGANFNIDSIKDVEDMIKGVLTDESQESQESNANPIQTSTQQALSQHILNTGIMRPTSLQTPQNNLSSPLSFPPQSPYHSEYSNSPQFSPAFSEPPSPWVSVTENTELDTTVGVTSTYNQRSSEKMKADESLGSGATISAVLYANINHPEWKTEFPTWTERNKQIIKKWRTLSSDQKAPYLQKARDNRSAQRMKKQQQSQISKEGSSSPKVTKVAVASAAATAVAPTDHSAVSVNSSVITSGLMDPTSIITSISTLSEVCTSTNQSRSSLTTATTSTTNNNTTPAVVFSPFATITTPASRSPSTPHQFTVHGHFLTHHNNGPAPNVTVNPNYQAFDHAAPPVNPHSRLSTVQQQSTTPNTTDQQIRVLTPSEIMRTLPSLCQENYEPIPLQEQEKVTNQNKSTKEAEQERQWKQLQAMRQQQAQQQQHVIQEQRIQAIARVQRQISDTSQLIMQEPDALLHVKSADDTSLIMPSPTRTQTFQQVKYQDFTQASSDITQQKLSYIENKDMNAVITSNILDTSQSQSFQQKIPAEKYIFQSAPIKTQFQLSESTLQRLNLPEQVSEGTEVNPQLRDLLQGQGQQFKKLDERLIGKGQQRVWPPVDSNAPETSTTPMSLADLTFRQPLPPNAMRPKLMIPANPNLRDPLIGFKQQLNPRMRVLLQHQQVHKLQLMNDSRRLPQMMQQQTKEANIASILSELPGVSEQDLQKHLSSPPYELKLDNQHIQQLNIQQLTLNQQQQQLVSQHQQQLLSNQHNLSNQQLSFLTQNKLNQGLIRKQMNPVIDKSEQVKNLTAHDVREKIKMISRSLSQPHDAGDISSLIEEELAGQGGSR